MSKPFPANVNWCAVWKHRWLLLDALNQVAHGDMLLAQRTFGGYYGASESWCARFYKAANDVIKVG